MRSRALATLWAVSAVLLAALWWRPEATTLSKLLVLCCAAAVVVTPFVLWRSARARGLAAAVFLLGGVLLVLPGRAPAPDALAEAYVQRLRAFDGTRYVWGGENHRGIDCSGLVRVSLTEASLDRAIASFDPSLLRRALALWWFDASAQALGEGYRGWTREIARAASLRALDPALLRKGDLAVTADGTHVLAYLGDSTWIQADPVPMQTHVEAVTATSRWFGVPVIIWRWTSLEQMSKATTASQ